MSVYTHIILIPFDLILDDLNVFWRPKHLNLRTHESTSLVATAFDTGSERCAE